MKILEARALRGPNYYHRKPVVFMRLDLEELEERPTHLVPNFLENIREMMPSLYEHTCSPRVKGGFFQRIERGTWAGHVTEHVALELQNLIGHHITFGKTYTMKPKGIYNMVYRYLNEEVGMRAGEMAIEIVNKLFEGQKTDIAPLLVELQRIEKDSKFGPSTQSIVDEATSRGIPYKRLNEYSYVQFGQGKYQRRIEATLMDDTSALAVSIAGNKERTKEILGQNGIPVPQGKAVTSLEQAIRTADRVGYPVVLKPLSGNHGRGVVTDIRDESALREAYQQNLSLSGTFVVEQYITGDDYRMMVIDGKFQAAALRQPAYVVGDGQLTLLELIDRLNQDPKRGDGHEKVLTRVKIDQETERVITKQGYDFDNVVPEGVRVNIKETANISSGGTAIDVTDRVHPTNIFMAERISRLIGLNVMGIDIMAPTLEEPLEQGKAGIVEVNAGPGFRMHLEPSEGEPRNIAKPVVDMLFPEGTPHSIPICAVTGTNGKTTTTRLISHILSHKGCCVGMTSTDGVVVNNIQVLKGDYSGPSGAQAVMQDPTVDYAVLEVARGGILRRGLGFQQCDVGVLLNITSDHLGFGGIDTLEQLARAKSVVTSSVKKDGYAVFNAEDPMIAEHVKQDAGTPIYFAKDPNHPTLQANLLPGRFNVTLVDQQVVIQKLGGNYELANVHEIPITFDGLATFNIENVLAAVAATYAMGVTEDQILSGLISFSPSVGQSPGRMNVIDMGDFKVIVDYGHNPGAIHATGEFMRKMMPGKKIRMASGVGNRREEDIMDYGRAVATYFDHVVLCDSSPRIRKLGETAEIVKQGLMDGGLAESDIDIVYEERKATRRALEIAGPGDLVVLQAEDIARVTQDVFDFKTEYLDRE